MAELDGLKAWLFIQAIKKAVAPDPPSPPGNLTLNGYYATMLLTTYSDNYYLIKQI